MSSAALPPVPQSVRDMMRAIGPKWGTDIGGHVRMVLDAYTAILAGAPKEGIVTREVSYGPHPRHVLDVFAPRGASGAPVVIFLHGGAFVDGNKDRTPEIYSNIGWFLARNGVVCVNLEYRLAPEFRYPAAALDVAAAVAWARVNIARFGGDSEAIFLAGHSAGAAHVGVYAYDRTFHPPEGPGIRGLIVLSGRVRCENWPDNPNAKKVEAYLGTDPALHEQGSVVTHVSAASVPTMVVVGQYENPLIDLHCAELVYRLSAAKRRTPRFVWLEGHTHSSTMAQINTGDDRVGPEMLAFIRQGS